MKSSEGRGVGIALAPSLGRVTSEYQRLNTREARVAFIDSYLKVWAYSFERSWPVIYQALRWVEEEKLYSDPRAMNPNEVFSDFKSFFEARLKKPFATWFDLERTHHYVERYAPELIETTWTEARKKAAEHAQKIDAQTPDLKAAHRPKKGDNTANDITLSQRGTSNAYAIAKLRKDRPDIHARVLAGEISAHAGMVEAGFRKKRASRRLTKVDRVTKLLGSMTRIERREIWRLLAKEFK